MTGIIRAPRPTTDYFDVRNATARDTRLSYRARGILIRLLSNADGYRMTSVDLAREGKEGRGAVLTALKELRHAGYVYTFRAQNAQGRWITETYVYDTPQSTEVQKPDSGSRDTGFPDAGYLDPNKNNQEHNQQKNQQKNQKQQCHAGSNKVRRVRPSGIVAWTASDTEVATRIEADNPPARLRLAVDALHSKGKEPVPGLVQRQIEASARLEIQRSATTEAAARHAASQDERLRRYSASKAKANQKV